MRITLVHPPWAEVYGHYQSASRIGNAYPPLGLCYLASIIERAGHQARVIDAEQEGLSVSDVVSLLRSHCPEVVGVTATTSIAYIAESLAKQAREVLPETTFLLGGPHCSALPEECLGEEGSFDFALYGEAERSISSFLDMLEGTAQKEEVPGLIYRDDLGGLRRNPPPQLVENLDELPFPARGKLHLERYTWSVPGRGIVKFTPIMTSRGCPFHCIFCSAHTVFGRKVRSRSIESVLDEIEHCVSELGIDHFSFIDDTLTLNRKRTLRLVKEMKNRRLNITWEGWTRANTVDEELLKEMRKAGFIRISFGIETADPRIEKIVKKGVPLKAYEPAYKAAKRAGIETRGSVILGMPGETWSTAIKTLLYIRRLHDCDQMYINIATPYPGTELFDIASESRHGMKLLTTDYSQYRRYGDSVVEVNDLSPKDLARLQRVGFMLFYLTPKRVWYNFRRAGPRAFWKNAKAFSQSVIWPSKE